MFKLHYQFTDSLSDDLCTILKSPERLMLEGHLLKDDKSTTLVKITHNDKEYVVKRFNPRSAWHKIKRALRKTRAASCWEMSHIFQECGLKVPNPVAKIEKKWGCFVTEQIIEIFSIFKENNLSHGDMKATNLLRCNSKLFLIDLDVAKQHRSGLTFLKAHKRDKKRFCRNGDLFNEMLRKYQTV